MLPSASRTPVARPPCCVDRRHLAVQRSPRRAPAPCASAPASACSRRTSLRRSAPRRRPRCRLSRHRGSAPAAPPGRDAGCRRRSPSAAHDCAASVAGARLRGEEQVAALGEADVRPLAVDVQALADAAQEFDAVERDGDVDRQRRIAGGSSPPTARVAAKVKARVLLDQQHAAAEGRVGREMIGSRRTMHGAADDDDVRSAIGTPARRPTMAWPARVDAASGSSADRHQRAVDHLAQREFRFDARDAGQVAEHVGVQVARNRAGRAPTMRMR